VWASMGVTSEEFKAIGNPAEIWQKFRCCP
jgi:hypothetical protein